MSRVAVGYGEMEEGRSTLQTCSGQIIQAVQDLRGKLDALEWGGQDRDAYQQVMDEMDRDANEVGEICGTIANAVGTALQNYQDNEAANVRTWG